LCFLNNKFFVDISIGVCSCDKGQDGSPCKHQYLIWAAKLTNSLNFAPVESPELRQKLAMIALGSMQPVSKYTSLRGNLSIQESSVAVKTVAITSEPQMPENDIRPQLDTEQPGVSIGKAREWIQEACELLVNKLESSQDTKLAEGALKFASRLQRLTTSMGGDPTSSLFSFGVNELSIRKKGRKIQVQPNRRRKSAIQNRQTVGKGQPVSLKSLEIPRKKPKQTHSLASSVRQNTNTSKNSAQHAMKSKSRHL